MRRAAMLTLLVAMLPATAAWAQAAQVGARASITTSALVIGQLGDLSFGNVVPGTPTFIDPGASASAGQFEIQGTRNAEVAVTMTLPSQLSTGFWTMPVSFGATSGCYKRGPVQGGCTYWDPNTVLVARIRNQNPPNNHLWIWVGGTVSPAPTQTPGVYLGTLTMSVVYTGN